MVSERTASALPERLSGIARLSGALSAFVGHARSGAAQSAPSGVRDAGEFSLPVRASSVARFREAWPASCDRYRLEEMILAPRLARCVTVAVMSPKGGVGKTTTAALLGSLLAFLRRDRVVAVDCNPDWGSLGRRLVSEHSVFIDDLLAGVLAHERPRTVELDAQLGRGPDGLMIAPAPTDPDRAGRLDEDAYRGLFARLGALVGTLILDCGTGLGSPAGRAALGCADQLVLVTDGEPDTASLVAEAAWQRFAAQSPPPVLLINKLSRRSRLDLVAVVREIGFAEGVVLVPHDRTGAEALQGGRFSWTRAPAGWEMALRELAALLAASWRRLGLAR
jgi:MinD-like ATPase involved in chromosome partitioning or flagellar assembly